MQKKDQERQAELQQKQLEEQKINSCLQTRSVSFGDVYAQTVNDTIEQYDIAKQQGDKIQICVQAGLVSAAVLQAKDSDCYSVWKDVEKSACRAAGVPQL